MFRGVRRKEREMSQEETVELLREGEYGVLSLNGDSVHPYGVPLSYVYLDDSIYFHCATEGHKIEHLSQNNKVSFCVVGKTKPLPDQFSMKYQSVIVFGQIEEVISEEKRKALVSFLEKYATENMVKGMKYLEKDEHRAKVFKIAIIHMTGKSRK